ncbi:polysaccharide deacetylase family protein [Geodermatophilus aquaeductus]|uniref:Polysaccharide deacetylase n=1 Tax=Geodermatophilus aquaeductus TaxID=1564161 RepID=A0A521FQP7_9ACTN|nr:polysaccharide deacetylase family protein [Geodermatophilus aquaeductus]SMO98518.1 Polysaccharide deacetylase [Geodermatophilus aquaeductus]
MRDLWARRPAWPRRLRPRGSDVVLLYHRISDDLSDDPGGMVVPPALFREHLEAVTRWFGVVRAADVRGPHDRPTAAITLDDGYLDNLEHAAPVLRDLGVPATFFVVADAVAPDPGPEYWWDRLEHLVLEPGPGPATLPLRIAGRRVVVDVSSGAARSRSYAALTTVLHRRPPEVVSRVLTRMEEAWPRPGSCHRHRRMSAAQVQDLARDPLFDIGSHTCSHSALATLPRGEARRELLESRTALGGLLGRPPQLLAYPFGAPGTVARRNARQARAAGYDLAFVNVPGPVERADPHALPRITVGRWSVDHLHRAVTAWRPR